MGKQYSSLVRTRASDGQFSRKIMNFYQFLDISVGLKEWCIAKKKKLLCVSCCITH